MGEAKKRAQARLTNVAACRYARGTAVLAYRKGAHPEIDAGAFLSLVEAEMRAPAALRHEAAGRSPGSLDSLMVHGELDDGRWHLFTPDAGYVAVRDALPADLLPSPGEPCRHHRLAGRPFTLSGSRARGLSDADGEPFPADGLRGLLRIADDGRVLCEADAPLALQRLRVGPGEGHATHLDILASHVEAAAPRDALAAADLAGLADLRPGRGTHWRDRHFLLTEGCWRWSTALGPAAVDAFVRGIGAPPPSWEADPAPDTPAGRALAQVAGIGLPTNRGLRVLVPDAEALRIARDWLSRSFLVAREEGVLAGTASGVVAALATPAEGRPVLLAWPAAAPAPDLPVPADDAADPAALAALYRSPGPRVGARIAVRFEDPDDRVHLAPVLLLRAHAAGRTLSDLADAIVARALSERSSRGALGLALGGRTAPAAIDPDLALFVRCDSLDPWALRAPATLAGDLAALDAAASRGCGLPDVAREAIFGLHASEPRAA